MPFELPADPGDPGRPSTGIGRVDERRTGFRHRLLRDGAEVIAHGALVCPRCNLPIAIADRAPAAAVIECGFCEHAAPMRAFLAADVFDTVANEAQLVARLRAAGGP